MVCDVKCSRELSLGSIMPENCRDASKKRRKRGRNRVYDADADAELVREYKNSGLTQKDFAKQKNMPLKTFKRAYDRHAKR